MLKKMIAIIMAATLWVAGSAFAAPFGGTDDVAYSTRLWQAMVRAKMVGPNSIMSTPYTGQHPHGAILDTIEGSVTVLDNTGTAIIKRNYGGKDITKQKVADDPAKYLKAVTVMYKRKGYDADDKDWFWVKYKPDGSLHTNPKGMQLAGMIAKGKPKGCISCHTAAPGGDMVFNHD